MFLKFKTETERSHYGGTAFIEFQYCKLDKNVPLEGIFEDLPFWYYEDGLYVYLDELNFFENEYRELLGETIYHNKSCGLYDVYGINYFKPENIDVIIQNISKVKPTEYEIMVDWLEKAKKYNGFYLLGL